MAQQTGQATLLVDTRPILPSQFVGSSTACTHHAYFPTVYVANRFSPPISPSVP